MSEVQRLFFALWPEVATQEQISHAAQAVIQEQKLKGRRTDTARLHLTLLFLGDLDPSYAPLAGRAADAVRAAPFDLQIDRLGYFYGAKVLWAGPSGPPAGLMDLWMNLRDAMQAGRIPHERRKLIAHITCLRRVERPLRTVAIEPIVWPVREFVLIHSVLSGRPEYRILGRWRLVARTDTQSGAGVKSGAREQLWENAPGPDRK